MSLENRVAVVTGGGSGMGRATCLRLARDGAAVAVWDWNETGASETLDMVLKAGGRAIGCKVNIASSVDVARAAERTRQELGPITILINNAGIGEVLPFHEISEDKWDRMIDINLKGAYLCSHAVISDMIGAKWGRIVNITSGGYEAGPPSVSHYIAAKGGLVGLTRGLAADYGALGITANAISPGSIDTPMARNNTDFENVSKHFPMRRPGKPEDIAAACAFFCSEDANYITGQTLGVNGGATMD